MLGPLTYGAATLGGGFATYAEQLVDDYGASEVWPLVDIASGTTITAHMSSDRDGTLSGFDLQNDAGPAGVSDSLLPYLDGNDYGDIFTSSLASLFDSSAGGVFVIGKVPSAAWTDGAQRRIIQFSGSSGNEIFVYKNTTSNQLVVWYRTQSALEISAANLTIDTSTTDYWSLALTWDVSNDESIVYWNGEQIHVAGASTAFAGAITAAYIGASSTSPGTPWIGNVGWPTLWAGTVPAKKTIADMHAIAFDTLSNIVRDDDNYTAFPSMVEL